MKRSVFCRFPSKTTGSFPLSDSSSPCIRFGCHGGGPGEGPLNGGEGDVGGRGGDGPRGGGEGSRFGGLPIGVLLSVGGAVLVDSGVAIDFSSGVAIEDNVGPPLVGVGGRVFTNFCSYGDSINLGLVGSGFGSARNMRFRRSSVQYWSSGVSRRGPSSLFVRAAGSTRTAC